eukprot:14226337-Alexandrium_andersonii.AAC.1
MGRPRKRARREGAAVFTYLHPPSAECPLRLRRTSRLLLPAEVVHSGPPRTCLLYTSDLPTICSV